MIASNRFVRLLPCAIAIALSAGCGTTVPCPEGTTASGTQCVTVWGHVEGTLTLELQSDHSGVYLALLGTPLVATTAADGKFTMGAVKAGDYTIEARRAGFETARFPVTIADGKAATVTGMLKLGGGGEDSIIRGNASQLGIDDQSGTTVTVEDLQISTTTGADGSFVLPGVPLGVHTLLFNYGPYTTRVPSVLAIPGTDGLVIAGAVYPFAPIDLPRAQKLVDESLSDDLAKDNTAVVTEFTDSLTRETRYRVATVTGASTLLEAGALVPTLSPTGKKVLYQVREPQRDTTTLKAMAVTGGDPVVVATGLKRVGPVTADDARVIYFVTHGEQFDLMTASLAGGASAKLLTVTESEMNHVLYGDSYARAFSFSADSKYALLVANNTLQAAPLDGQSPPLTIAAVTGDPYYITCPPKGDRVVYRMDDTTDVYVASIAANPNPTKLGTLADSPNVFTADGRYTWFNKGYTTGYMLVDLTTGQSVLLERTGSGRILDPVFTLDSSAVLYCDGQSLKRRILSTGETTTLTALPADASPPMLSNDGRTAFLLLGAQANQLSALDVVTGEIRTVFEASPSTGPWLHSISPDGSKLLMVGSGPRGKAIMVMPATGGTPSPLFYGFELTFTGGWTDSQTLFVRRRMTPTPFSSQDGFYKVSVP